MADWMGMNYGGYTAEQIIGLWNDQVHARGHLPTRFPDGPRKGQLAERYLDSSGTSRYAAAPPAVERVHQAIIAQEDDAIAWGQRLQLLEDAVRGAGTWAAQLPRAAGQVLALGVLAGLAVLAYLVSKQRG